MNIYDLLELIHGSPTRFLKGKSLRALWVFLCGYETALSDCRRTDVTLSDLRPFSEYVATHNGYAKAGARSWFEIISSKNDSDEKAYDLFFALLTDFKKENPAIIELARRQ